jgi:DNA-directed RNA polymerase subunit F
MIKDQKALSMSEVAELAGDTEKETKLKAFIKQFVKLDAERARKMRAELVALDSIKLKDEHLVKIIDFTPDDAADLIKVLPGVSLNQDEVTKILDIVKKY